MVTSYGGVGSIIESVIWGDNFSFMVESYRNWTAYQNDENRKKLEIKDSRLLERLRSIGLVLLNNPGLVSIPSTVGARVHYFPRYMFCKKTFELKLYDDWENQANAVFDSIRQNRNFYKPQNIINNDGKAKRYPLIQVPYISVCSSGHIQDIPWAKILVPIGSSSIINDDEIQLRDNGTFDKILFGVSKENPKSPGDYVVGIKDDKITHALFLKNLGVGDKMIKCCGGTPWIAKNEFEKCDGKALIHLITSNSIYFANTVKSIYIPQNNVINSLNEENQISIKDDYDEYIQDGRYSEQEATQRTIEKYGRRNFSRPLVKEFLANGRTAFDGYKWTEKEYRAYEFARLTNGNNNEEDLVFYKMSLTDALRNFGFSDIIQVKKLKQITVQTSFTRLAPIGVDAIKVNDESDNFGEIEIEANHQNLSIAPKSTSGQTPYTTFYIPAVETFGEGILFVLDNKKVGEWAQCNEQINQEVERLKAYCEQSFLMQKKRDDICPELLLIHTLSHLLIRELQYSVGYDMAALSERLYQNTNCTAVLIYTVEGTGGSLGGLQGLCNKPENIFEIVKNALNRAKDCSYDPVCYGEEQGLDKLNYAACNSCCHVPFMTCEYQNVFLNRAMLVDKEYGFFRNIQITQQICDN